MVIFIQFGPENDEKVIPGRAKSRPWSGHGSDALSGAFLSVCRRCFFLTFRSLFEDFFGPRFDDFSNTIFLMKKVVFFENGRFVSTRASLLKVRCRFGGSRERPESAKSAPREVKKSDLKDKQKI